MPLEVLDIGGNYKITIQGLMQLKGISTLKRLYSNLLPEGTSWITYKSKHNSKK